MRNINKIIILLGLCLQFCIAQASRKVIRVTEMDATMRSELSRGKLNDITLEFRQGDELPISFEAQGDLLETRQNSISYIGVKKNFWLLLNQDTIEMSLDGTNFKKMSEVITGSLEAGTGTGQSTGVVESINFVLKAFLKK